jgi:hypothetical protein
MPPRANLCSMLVELKREVLVNRSDENVLKHDMCDIVDSRISQIVKQLISTPYCNNFSFEIDKPPECDSFDRVFTSSLDSI